MIRPILIAAALLLPAAAATRQQADQAIATDPARTQIALRYLLAATATPAASGAYCSISVAGKPRPTLGDHLAGTLANLDEGQNLIAGDCVRDRCRVRIRHPGGEAPFDWEYRFRVARGRMVPGSLGCFGA